MRSNWFLQLSIALRIMDHPFGIQVHGLQPVEFRDGGLHGPAGPGEGLFNGVGGLSFRLRIAPKRLHSRRQLRRALGSSAMTSPS